MENNIIQLAEEIKNINNKGFKDYLPIEGLQCDRTGKFLYFNKELLPKMQPGYPYLLIYIYYPETNFILKKKASTIVFSLFGNPNIIRQSRVNHIDGNIHNLHIDNLICKDYPKGEEKNDIENNIYINKFVLETLINNNRTLAAENYDLRRKFELESDI